MGILSVTACACLLVSMATAASVYQLNGCDNESCFNPQAYCKHCLSQRNVKDHFAHPFHCSKYLQCTSNAGMVRAIEKKCGPCTYWDQASVTCVSAREANCPAGVSPVIMQSIPGTCVRYQRCSPTFEKVCCAEKYHAFSEKEQRCVPDESCSDPCEVTTESPVTEPYSKPIGKTCFYRGWRREIIPDSETSFYLLWNGKRYERRTCRYGLKFDIPRCICEDECMTMWLNFNSETDVGKKNDALNNYIDYGTTQVRSGKAYFDGKASSSIEAPIFNNQVIGDKFAVSLWFKSDVRDDKLSGLVTNGNCFGNGSVNVWAYKDTIRAGLVTPTNNEETAFISADAARSEWHFVVVTYDGAMTTLYVDNEKVGSKKTTGPVLVMNAPFTFGSNFCKHGHFNGAMDEIRFFKCHLDADQVEELYEKGYSSQKKEIKSN